MADDFKMTIKENGKSVSLELSGAFDRGSARNVLKFIKSNYSPAFRFVVDTSRLIHESPAKLIQEEWSQWDG